MKKVLNLFIILISCFMFMGCEKKVNQEGQNMIVIELSDGRKINLELYPEVAPITVANFYKLIDEHQFDNVIFHRIIRDFMIQAGMLVLESENSLNYAKDCPTIKGEFAANGVQNNLKHTKGVISMARTDDYNSASSQFFICSADSPHLDGKYAAFGKVTDSKSLQVVEDISYISTGNFYGMNDFPLTLVTIKTIRRA